MNVNPGRLNLTTRYPLRHVALSGTEGRPPTPAPPPDEEGAERGEGDSGAESSPDTQLLPHNCHHCRWKSVELRLW